MFYARSNMLQVNKFEKKFQILLNMIILIDYSTCDIRYSNSFDNLVILISLKVKDDIHHVDYTLDLSLTYQNEACIH